jgi:hypothetical protein
MATLATKEDFEARHGVLDEDDQKTVDVLLVDAGGLIETELAGSEAAWLGEDFDGEVPAVVKAVCIQAAYRAWVNPDGVAREELGQVAQTYRGTDQADALWLTKNEAKMVRRAAGASSIRSIQVETPYSGDPQSDVSPLDFWPLDEASS